MDGFISEVFWTSDKTFAFQRVGGYWRLYEGTEGYFKREFRSFKKMCEFIKEAKQK